MTTSINATALVFNDGTSMTTAKTSTGISSIGTATSFIANTNNGSGAATFKIIFDDSTSIVILSAANVVTIAGQT